MAEGVGLLRDGRYRVPVIGLVTVITIIALEAIAVATVMPTTVRALHALHWFGWTFTAFFLADVVGMVLSGAHCDRHGPGPSLLGGLVVFAAGLFVAGVAGDISVFVLGRALQGLGGGAVIVAAYVVVARVFPPPLQPRVFAAVSGAWVVPSLVGPVLAGAVTDAWSWRWVFLGLAPFAAVGAVLLMPTLRQVPRQDAAQRRRLGPFGALVLAGGLALLQAAGQRHDRWSIGLGALGAALLVPPMLRLMPAGAFRLERGLPTVVVLRGLLSGGFFGAEAYLPLSLARLHHGSPTEVGIPLTVAAVSWATGSWWQGRRSEPSVSLLRAGFALVAIGVGALTVLTVAGVSMWVALPMWFVAGGGMGLAMSTLSVLTLALSPTAEQGANTSALQVSDMVGSILAIGAAATVVAVLGPAEFASALRIVDPLLALAGVTGALLCSRAGVRAVRR